MKERWQPVAVVALLLALLTILLVHSRSPDLPLGTQMHEALQDYQLHDAELGRDVLLARAGLLPNYDALARDRQSLGAALDALWHISAGGTAGAEAALSPYLRRIADAQRERLIEVEHFKSTNALLRNSLMYLSFAGPVLRVPMKQQALAAEMGRLSYAVLRYVQSPDKDVEAEILAVLNRLSRVLGAPIELQTLVAHGRLIIRVLPEADTLMRSIIQAPTGVAARALQQAVLQYSSQVEGRAQLYRYLLYAVSLLLLAYLVHQFNRLRAGARVLRSVNASLNLEVLERTRANAALRASDARYHAITESAKEAIVTVDVRGLIRFWNAGAAAMFGYPSGQILGTRASELLPAARRRVYDRAILRLFTTRRPATSVATREFAGLRRDGAEFPVEVSVSLWSTDEGRYLTAVMRDVSVRKRLEETTRQQQIKLIQTNKMTALGTLVAGVAHEINSPTQLILLNARKVADAWREAREALDGYAADRQALRLGGLPYAEMRELLPVLADDICGSALRIQCIVADLKDFARPGAPDSAAGFNLNDAVQRAYRLLAHLISSKTAVFRMTLGSDLPEAWGDGQHFEQVVVNLLVNALESLPARHCAVNLSTGLDLDGRALLLIVEDQGIGISPEHLERLCDPFFTTKQASGGTGLGLAITENLVRAHGGQIQFESERGRGTRVSVRLRCATAPLHPAAAAAGSVTP